MTTYAGRPVFPAFFVDASGRPKPNLSVTIYNRGTLVKPTLYTDRTKSAVAANPTTTDALGNLWVFLDPGDYDLDVGASAPMPFSVLPEVADVAEAGPTADLLAGKADAAATTAALAGKEPTIPPGTYVEFVNVKKYGAVGNGVADDTAAIEAAIVALPALSGTFDAASGVLYFPAGRYITSGGHVIPSTKRVTVRGDGPYISLLSRKAAATGDLLTINSKHSGVENLTLDGDVPNAPAGGDGLVLNAAYTYAENCTIINNKGNGISVGKAAGAILYRLQGLLLRLNRGYGVNVFPTTGSTDGEWLNVDIGNSGLAGVRLQSAAQQLVNVHVWGSGLEAASVNDKAGFYLNSPNNMLSNCESETNLGDGVLIASTGADGQKVSGGDLWGNTRAGLYSFGGTRWHAINGVGIRNNGVANTTGAASNAFANINNDGGTDWSIDGNILTDDGTAVPAGSYGTYTPTNPYLGRAAVFTVYSHYAESGAADRCTIVGNQMRAALSRGGKSMVLVGTAHEIGHNVE